MRQLPTWISGVEDYNGEPFLTLAKNTETDKYENLSSPSFYLAPFWVKVIVFLKSNLTLFPVQ